MSAKNNRALIESYFETISGAATDRDLGGFFSPDVTWRVPQSNPMYGGKQLTGLVDVMQLMEEGVNIYQQGSLLIHLQSTTADSERVCAQFTLDAVLANGTPYCNHYVMIFAIENNKITAVWEYLDTLYQSELGTFDS